MECFKLDSVYLSMENAPLTAKNDEKINLYAAQCL